MIVGAGGLWGGGLKGRRGGGEWEGRPRRRSRVVEEG